MNFQLFKKMVFIKIKRKLGIIFDGLQKILIEHMEFWKCA